MKNETNLNRIRNDYRKVDFEEYRNGCAEDLLQKFKKGQLDKDTSVETIRQLMYGYTFTDHYSQDDDEIFSVDFWRCLLDDENYTENIQEYQIIDALLSSGDGRTPESAFCVIAVSQEYELMSYLFKGHIPKIIGQSVSQDDIDCIEFEPNSYGIEKMYFDAHRLFEVTYKNSEYFL